eukprot:snap_masked-scaffold_29-processed-gene-0.29-mRNA-1 protein AED:1.00 eAED:1.00 QI:0/0/0/0/1/1/3/0/74
MEEVAYPDQVRHVKFKEFDFRNSGNILKRFLNAFRFYECSFGGTTAVRRRIGTNMLRWENFPNALAIRYNLYRL